MEYTKKTILNVLLASLSPCLSSSPNILAKTTLETMAPPCTRQYPNIVRVEILDRMANSLPPENLETMIESIRVYSWFKSCKTIKGNENFNKTLFTFPLVKFMEIIILLRIYNLTINRGKILWINRQRRIF